MMLYQDISRGNWAVGIYKRHAVLQPNAISVHPAHSDRTREKLWVESDPTSIRSPSVTFRTAPYSCRA